jgi:hypothetical protein
MRRVKAFCGRLIRCSKAVSRDERIPRPFRWCFKGAVLCLVIPGPVDEVVLLVLVALVVIFWRTPVVEAWRGSL